MVRLRYYSTDNLLYTNWLTLGPNFIIRGIINTTSNHIQIIEFNSELVYEYQGNSLRDAKTTMRNQLMSMGVNFDGEIRSRQ